MSNFYTPKTITTKLAQIVPKKIYSVLDPSVGDGKLIEPIVRSNRFIINRMVCVDTSKSSLEKVRKTLMASNIKKFSCINDDFLTWSQNYIKKFDCIIMNPPFYSRQDNFYNVNLQIETSGKIEDIRKISIEAFFIVRSLRLLKQNGYLFAVLPSYVISGEKTKWLRKLLIENGTIEKVYEFPERSFSSVDGCVYLLKYTKRRARKIYLYSVNCNSKIKRLAIEKRRGIERIDYKWQKTNFLIKRIIVNSPQFMWKKLGELSGVERGNVRTPVGDNSAIHSIHYQNGFWGKGCSFQKDKDPKNKYSLKEGDLLVKRVGRKCSKSFGIPYGFIGVNCTDCLFIIRPNKFIVPEKLLLAIRVVANSDIGKFFLERGIAANYITKQSIVELPVPTSIFKNKRRIVEQYCDAIAIYDNVKALEIERKIRKEIFGEKNE